MTGVTFPGSTPGVPAAPATHKLVPLDPAGTGMAAVGLARAEQLYPHVPDLFTRHGVMEIYRAMVAAAPDGVDVGLEHEDTARLRYVYSGAGTESDALVNLELRLFNGDPPTLDEVRAAIDEARTCGVPAVGAPFSRGPEIADREKSGPLFHGAENSLECPEAGLLSNLRTDEPDTSMAGDDEPYGVPVFDQALIAKAVMTPDQEAAAQQGRCPKCDLPSLAEKHREGGVRWLQCSHCTSVYALGVDPSRGGPDA